MGANPTRQLSLRPGAIGAVMEVTKWLKPSVMELPVRVITHRQTVPTDSSAIRGPAEENGKKADIATRMPTYRSTLGVV